MAVRLIKKYPNRRLNDTRTSTYINPSDVKKLVLKKESLTVIDAKTGDDLTRSILLQIILEAEAAGAPMFSSDMLAQMIRFYGTATQGVVGQYMEGSMRSFLDMQEQMRDQAKTLMGESALNPNAMWQQLAGLQPAPLQKMMKAYVDGGQQLTQQMQEMMTAQWRSLFGTDTSGKK